MVESIGHLLGWIFGILLLVTVGVVTRVLGEDVTSAVPRWSKALIEAAARRLSKRDHDRYLEEWLSTLEEIPETSRKLFFALNCRLLACYKLRETLADTANSDGGPRAIEVLLYPIALSVRFFTFVLFSFALLLEGKFPWCIYVVICQCCGEENRVLSLNVFGERMVVAMRGSYVLRTYVLRRYMGKIEDPAKGMSAVSRFIFRSGLMHIPSILAPGYVVSEIERLSRIFRSEGRLK